MAQLPREQVPHRHGGFVTAKWLDPLKPERADHVLVALGCLVLSLLSVGFSVVYGLALFRS